MMKKHKHEFRYIEFVWGGYWECESCLVRPTERQWNRWARAKLGPWYRRNAAPLLSVGIGLLWAGAAFVGPWLQGDLIWAVTR